MKLYALANNKATCRTNSLSSSAIVVLEANIYVIKTQKNYIQVEDLTAMYVYITQNFYDLKFLTRNDGALQRLEAVKEEQKAATVNLENFNVIKPNTRPWRFHGYTFCFKLRFSNHLNKKIVFHLQSLVANGLLENLLLHFEFWNHCCLFVCFCRNVWKEISL